MAGSVAPEEEVAPRRSAWLEAGAAALLAVLGAVALGALVDAIQFPASAQTRINLAFAARDDYLQALTGYRRWPPAYVTLLWSAERVGVDHHLLNAVLFGACLAAVWWTSRRIVPGVHPALPTATYALVNAHLRVHSWATSEPLFVPLALLTLMALVAYGRTHTPARLAALTACAALLCLTRYFAVFWLLPLAALNLLATPGPWKRRLGHTAAFSLLAAAPIGAWLWKEYRNTGFLTGMNRFEPRRWNDEADFVHNVAYTLKTFLYDLLSPVTEATHQAMRLAWPPSTADVVLPLLAAAALLAGVFALARGSKRGGGALRPSQSGQGLTLQLFAGYVVALVGVWTLGNNDPIYGRFLYPSYVFLILLVYALYERVRDVAPATWALRGLLALFVAVQLYRTWYRLQNPHLFQIGL